jgi:hypothetical protein
MACRSSSESRVIACAILIGVLARGGMVAADKKATPPTAKELVGVWVGFDLDELHFTRLEFRPDSTGFLARVAPTDTVLRDNGVHVYRVTSWRVDGWNIAIQMSPMSNAANVGYVRGHTGLASLRLTIGGLENGGWKEQLLLYPEARLTASNQETKEKIEETAGR